MKKHYWKKSLPVFLAGVLMMGMTALAEVDKLNVGQIVQSGREVYLYVNALDEDGRPVSESFQAEQFAVNIDEGPALPVQDAAVFSSLNQGASYIFCIDISKSVTTEEMEQIRSAISGFVNGMSANDYAKIITIGSEITSLCDFTQDKNALNTAVQAIDRTADYTYLYKGISQALDGQRKNVETMPKRAAVILFTDGMDDSDGASGEEQVLADVAETRIPIYVVGLKGNDTQANLNSAGQIANKSGGSVFSYNDMSVNDAVKTIHNIMNNTFLLHVQPEQEMFGEKSLEWKVTYNAGNYSVASARYVYSLGMDGVVFETEPQTTEAITETDTQPETTPVTEPQTEPEKTTADQVMKFVQENWIVVAAAGLILIALVIILVYMLRRNKKDDDFVEYTPTTYDVPKQSFEDGEKTWAEDMDDERTIDELDAFADDEATVDGSGDNGIRLAFEITFDGRTETVEKTLRDQLVLGRGKDCDVDVVLHSTSQEGKQTSRQHAFIMNQPDGLYVKDNSKNKTWLNGMEVLGEISLKNEDILQLGKATVKITILRY